LGSDPDCYNNWGQIPIVLDVQGAQNNWGQIPIVLDVQGAQDGLVELRQQERRSLG
jgi:hypothetical protein